VKVAKVFEALDVLEAGLKLMRDVVAASACVRARARTYL
jgi:hypothetical protein